MAAKLYGFRGCDTVRKAMKWLDANHIAYDFFDYRKDELQPQVVDDWFASAGWENVFNRNSTTYKELPEGEKAGITETRAKAMILAETNFIKRPVLVTGDAVLPGFKPDRWLKALGK